MTSHMTAWFENVNAVTDSELNVVQDDVLAQNTTERFKVPPEMNFVHLLQAMADNLSRARLVTPSLEVRRSRQTIVPYARDAAISLISPKAYKPVSPIELVPNEEMSIRVTNPTAGEDTWGIALLGPKELPAMPAGDIRRVRCLGTTTLVDSVWTTCVLTPDEQLEAGEYELVNMVAHSVTGIAARAIIDGQAWRPGVLAKPGASELVAMDYATEWDKILAPYAMGKFSHDTLPRVQFLASAADTAETVYLDMVKTG